jgi:hypothetical protein
VTDTPALPPDCRVRVEAYVPGRAAGDVLPARTLMERPEAAPAVFSGPVPPFGSPELAARLQSRPAVMFGICWLDWPSAPPETLRAAAPALASRLAAELGEGVREVAVWELPVVDEWWSFWVEPATEGAGG